VRSSSALPLPRGEPASSEPLVAPQDPNAELGRRLTALVLFRTIATTLILVLAALQLADRRPVVSTFSVQEVAWFTVVAVDYLLTLVSALLLRRGLVRTWLAWAQVLGAVAFASSIVLLTEVRDSPFWFTYLLAIIGGAVVLGMRGALGAAVAAGVSSLGVTVWGRLAHQAERPLLEVVTQVFAQVLVAGLSGYVAEQLIRTRGRLVESEEEVARTKELRDRIVTAIPSGLAVVESASGKVRFVNPAGRAILGVPEGTFPDVNRVFPGLLTVPVGRRWELIADTPKGELILGVSTSALAADTTLIVFQDLTEVRRREDEMARLDQLAELGRVSATLAHEVRNPLASMRGSAQMLLGDAPAGSPQERLSRIIVREADRLAYLVDHYLELARPKPPQRAHVRLDKLVTETVEVLRADPVARGTTVEEVLEPREESVDAAQIKQVLINLLRNAFRAAGPKGRVRVAVRQTGPVLFSVWDSAGAVSPDDLPHLFEPFYSREPDGTGLGLSTAQSIAWAHGARLTVSSNPQDGTTFEFVMQPGQGPAAPAPREEAHG
jgi:two-component system sensor histidine kinase PilS (NtrC family)